MVRREAGLKSREYPANFDVWWFRLPREGDAEFSFLPRVAPGKALGVIPREGYDQIAYLGAKGTDAQLRARGIEAFRRDVSALLPDSAEAVATLTSMDDIRHLDVRVDRLRRWHADGLLCIGDAAHAMSPLGGVGINMAVQDAVAAATILAEPLWQHRVTDRDLAAVRRRRLFPAAVTQAVQRVMQQVYSAGCYAAKIPRLRPPSWAWSIGCRGSRCCQRTSSVSGSGPSTHPRSPVVESDKTT